MSAGTHTTNENAKPQRRLIWIFGGAAIAVIAGGLLMQYFRAPAGQAADGTAGTARVARGDAKMAVVGGEVISYDAVAKECVERYGRDVLDDMIHRMIIAKACEAKQITVTEQEVSQEITRIAKRFNLDVPAYLQMLQTERNVTPMQYRTSVIWPMLALKKLAGDEVEITEDELNKAFVRNYGPRVKARVIMLDNLRQANKIWEEAKANPDNFDQLAQQHSVDPNSRALGGQIPPIPRYTGNEKLEEEAFKLKQGQISAVIELSHELSRQRFVILKCEGRTSPVVDKIDDVRDSLYDELKEAKTQQRVGKAFEELKESTRVDNYYARTTTGPATPVGGQQAPGGAVQAGGATTPRPATGATPGRATTTTGAQPRTSRN